MAPNEEGTRLTVAQILRVEYLNKLIIPRFQVSVLGDRLLIRKHVAGGFSFGEAFAFQELLMFCLIDRHIFRGVVRLLIA